MEQEIVNELYSTTICKFGRYITSLKFGEENQRLMDTEQSLAHRMQ